MIKIKKENNYYKKYNGNKTKEITLEVKIQVNKDITEEDLKGILEDMASESICDDIKEIIITNDNK
jgi:hypothetical protein